MSMLLSLLMVAQVLSAIGVIVLVLLQHGKGADMGAAFGSGASGSLFGATGSANFLSRFTAMMATVFFAATLALAFFGSQRPEAPRSIMEGAAPSDVPAVAPVPGSGAAPAAGGAASDVPSGTAPGSAQGGEQKSPAGTEIPK